MGSAAELASDASDSLSVSSAVKGYLELGEDTCSLHLRIYLRI